MSKDCKTTDDQVFKGTIYAILCRESLLTRSPRPAVLQAFGLKRLSVLLWKDLIHTDRHEKAQKFVCPRGELGNIFTGGDC